MFNNRFQAPPEFASGALQRVNWVDHAKAIGITLVVFGHVLHGVEKSDLPRDASLYALTESIVYSFHMPLFFMLAGLFLCASLFKRSFRSFLATKLDTIAYPYFFWSIIQGATILILGGVLQRDFGLAQLVSLLWAPVDQFWFLHALFIHFFVLAILLTLLGQRVGLTAGIALGLILYLLHPWLLFLTGPDLTGDRQLLRVTDNFIYLVVGAALGRYSEALGHQRAWLGSSTSATLALIVFALTQYIFHFVLSGHFNNKDFSALAVALVSITCVCVFALYLARLPLSGWARVGYYSMAIYLLHVFALTAARIGLIKLGIEDTSLHLLLGTLIGVVAPLAVAVLVDRHKVPFVFSAPLARWLRMAPPV